MEMRWKLAFHKDKYGNEREHGKYHAVGAYMGATLGNPVLYSPISQQVTCRSIGPSGSIGWFRVGGLGLKVWGMRFGVGLGGFQV